MAVSQKLGKLVPSTSALFVCDVQARVARLGASHDLAYSTLFCSGEIQAHHITLP